MKLCKLVLFHLKENFYRNLILYFIWIVFSFIVFIGAYTFIHSFQLDNISFMDYIFYIYGGAKEYVPTFGEPFKLPYLWLLNHLLILYFVLGLADNNVTGFKTQIFYRCKNRYNWWLSKCIIILVKVTVYYLTAYGIYLILYSSIYHRLTFEFNSDYIFYIIQFGDNLKNTINWNMHLECILLPYLFTLSMAYFQMFLSLFFKSVYTYLFSVIICIASSFKNIPFFIGNFAMAVRNDKIINGGVNTKIGIIVYLVIIACSIIIGMFKFKKYNVVERS